MAPPDGRILDGRNRYMVCRDLDVEPRFTRWDGRGSAVAFVVSLNIHRRHLTASQRAAIALDVLPMLEAEALQRMTAGVNQYSPVEIIPQATDNGRAREVAAPDPAQPTPGRAAGARAAGRRGRAGPALFRQCAV